MFYNKWKLCYTTCLSCSGLGNDTFHNCDSCIYNHYFIYETNDCVNEEYAKNNGFYLDNIEHTFYRCDIACSKCYKQYENNNTNCLECNTEQGYYPLSGKDSAYCYNNITTIFIISKFRKIINTFEYFVIIFFFLSIYQILNDTVAIWIINKIFHIYIDT